MFDINTIDWIVIAVYLAGLIFLAYWLSRGQFNREDYYVGGRNLSSWPIAISVMATQCSTNSILGAPAFVAFVAGGGLVWLQYELAVPLAMIALILIFLPLFRKLNLVTVYEYLEHRFDLTTRLVLSGLFMFIRAFATAVTVYSIAIVIDLITGIGFFWSVVILGVFTVVYDVLGGIKGVIYSDVLQMLILVSVLGILAVMLTINAGGIAALFNDFSAERIKSVDFTHHGLGDGQTFAFWPMLLGGFFLYVSYYGCDQSQVQRELSAKNIDHANQALFINGILRFPLVALYCFVGVGIGVFALYQPDFLPSLPSTNGNPNVNLAVPAYMIQNLPVGLVGLGLVALFAAAMSSLDSVLNSLSASTMEDFVRRFRKVSMTASQELWISRLITACWGALTLALAFFVDDIAPTVLETINKIGSLINGPVLGVFCLGILTVSARSKGAITGLAFGFLFNVALWVWFPTISWLWWNVFGFFVTFLIGLSVSRIVEQNVNAPAHLTWSLDTYKTFKLQQNWVGRSAVLFVWFLVLLSILIYITYLSSIR